MKKLLSVLAATTLIGSSVAVSAADAQSTSKASPRVSTQSAEASDLEGESGILVALLVAAAAIAAIIAVGSGGSKTPAPPVSN